MFLCNILFFFFNFPFFFFCIEAVVVRTNAGIYALMYVIDCVLAIRVVVSCNDILASGWVKRHRVLEEWMLESLQEHYTPLPRSFLQVLLPHPASSQRLSRSKITAVFPIKFNLNLSTRRTQSRQQLEYYMGVSSSPISFKVTPNRTLLISHEYLKRLIEQVNIYAKPRTTFYFQNWKGRVF